MFIGPFEENIGTRCGGLLMVLFSIFSALLSSMDISSGGLGLRFALFLFVLIAVST